MILIGSRALNFWDKSFQIKPNADWDVIGYPGEVNLPGRVEYHSPEDLNNSEVEKIFNSGHYLFGIPVCNMLGLSLIKRSHLWRDWFWDKHITHYHKHMHTRIVDLDNPFLKERMKLTKKVFPQGNPNLMQTNEEFFDDAVEKVYDHDWLHEMFSYGDRPMYERLKTPEGMDKAWCSKDLWLTLSDEEKDMCVAEECYVIATERFLVPSNWSIPPKLTYFQALKKVCTTLTSGWFRDWAIDNYPRIMLLYDWNKFQRVKEKL